MEKSMLKLGAARYVSKGDELKYLKWAIEEVLLGKKTGQLGADMPASVSNPFESLTPKELTVMIALFDGKSNKEIAEEYALSPSTVATYKQRMLEKTGSRSVTDMLKVAMQFHLYGFPGRVS
jgi:DNA-binding NarL/FixJ family response regulator